jgi:hypothetical protein
MVILRRAPVVYLAIVIPLFVIHPYPWVMAMLFIGGAVLAIGYGRFRGYRAEERDRNQAPTCHE